MNLNKLTDESQVIIQGITGKEGERVAQFMLSSGTKVVAGVRPGKGGQSVLGIPVYNSVGQARVAHPQATFSCVYVPPQHVKAAAAEAIAAGIEHLHIIGEGVPTSDTAYILSLAKTKNTAVIGPASLGFIIPGKMKIGSIGGQDNSSFTFGHVGLISRSGGMSSEISNILSSHHIGQSLVFHVGGDYLIGTTPKEVALALETDANTKVIVMIGEVGGSYEYGLVELLTAGKLTKPVVVFMAGQFVESLPQGVALGHAGAIIQSQAETRLGKIEALKNAGATVVETPDQIIEIVRQYL